MTSVSDPDALASDAHESTAVREKGRMRSRLGWIALATVVVLFSLFTGTLAFNTPDSRGGLDPESAKPSGSLALAELLRGQGVDIEITRSHAEAAAAVDDDTTLVMADPFNLSDDAVEQLIEPADHTVIVSTASRMLRLLDLGQNASGSISPLAAQCAVPELANVGTVRPERFFAPSDGVTGCFTDSSGASALLFDDRDGIRTVIVEASDLFSNAHLAEEGNAALGIALLGQTERIVWYVPSYDDTDLEGLSADTLADLTPGWVTPAILLLLLAGIVIAIARGQRFGPLVAETLPVTVRASETMHGRARLTAKAGDAAHAAQALREGTLRRLSARLGLTARSRPAEIADAASDRLRIPRGSLHQLLDGPLPTNDADLVDTARRFAELETAVTTAVHVERNTP